MSLTIERLKELLHYDPATGAFTRLVRCGRYMPGSRAGGAKKNGYRAICIDYEQHYEHRLAMFYVTGAWPPDDVDHRNVVPHDNRWQNIRSATRSQNGTNKPLSRANTSGFKGICLDKRKGLWAAYIKRAQKAKFLGYFRTKEAAHAAHMAAANRHDSAFARAS